MLAVERLKMRVHFYIIVYETGRSRKRDIKVKYRITCSGLLLHLKVLCKKKRNGFLTDYIDSVFLYRKV